MTTLRVAHARMQVLEGFGPIDENIRINLSMNLKDSQRDSDTMALDLREAKALKVELDAVIERAEQVLPIIARKSTASVPDEVRQQNRASRNPGTRITEDEAVHYVAPAPQCQECGDPLLVGTAQADTLGMCPECISRFGRAARDWGTA